LHFLINLQADQETKITYIQIDTLGTGKGKHSAAGEKRSIKMTGRLDIGFMEDLLSLYPKVEAIPSINAFHEVERKNGKSDHHMGHKNAWKHAQSYYAGMIFNFLRNTLFKGLGALTSDMPTLKAETERLKKRYPDRQLYLFIGRLMLAFTILKEGTSRIVVLVVEDICLIYENGYDPEMFDRFCEELEFRKFNRFNFAGSKGLIDALFEKYEATFDVTKHRIIYKCSQVSEDFSYSPGSLTMGNPDNLEALAEWGVAFSKDYDGTIRSKEEARATIISGIRKDNIYQWQDNGKVCAMAQVMLDEYDFPVIGHFYTDPAQRNKGYGSSVIHRITKGLLGAGNPFCMLAADAANPASNKAFIKAGYQPTGEYVRGYKPH
jgi:RimJ/RimL family protein N-acetyltransferase